VSGYLSRLVRRAGTVAMSDHRRQLAPVEKPAPVADDDPFDAVDPALDPGSADAPQVARPPRPVEAAPRTPLPEAVEPRRVPVPADPPASLPRRGVSIRVEGPLATDPDPPAPGSPSDRVREVGPTTDPPIAPDLGAVYRAVRRVRVAEQGAVDAARDARTAAAAARRAATTTPAAPTSAPLPTAREQPSVRGVAPQVRAGRSEPERAPRATPKAHRPERESPAIGLWRPATAPAPVRGPGLEAASHRLRPVDAPRATNAPARPLRPRPEPRAPAPPKAAASAPTVTLGTIRVEVVTPPPAPRPAPARPRPGPKPPAPSRPEPSPLRFGLGQI
jgi:hypothetical protein